MNHDLPRHTAHSDRILRRFFWVYFVLLLTEGALRKWFLPSLSTPLLIVRDPVAIATIGYAVYRNRFPVNPYLLVIALAAVVSFVYTMFIGHANLPIAIFGFRIYVIHLPVVFIFAQALRPADVVRVGRVLLWISLPCALLIVTQLYSPQSAWVNRGVGGDLEGSGFTGALGFYRPSGLFSFTNGNAFQFGLTFAFAVSLWLDRKSATLLALVLGTAGTLLAMPVSVSRAYLFGCVITLLFGFLTSLTSAKALGRVTLAGGGLFVLLLALSQTPTFEDASRIMEARFSNASELEGGLKGTLVNRYLGEMVYAFDVAQRYGWGGAGIGLGTNVGSQLALGTVVYSVAEDEWGRVLGEMGVTLGLMVILARCALAVHLGILALNAVRRNNNPLPWMLFSFAFLLIIKANLGQPVALGFTALTIVLLIASLKTPHPRITSPR